LHSKFKSAKWLILNNIDLSLKNYLDQEAIYVAIQKNNHLIVELILKTKNIDINQLDKDGRSLLQNAVLSGHTKIATDLINNAIDVNIVDKQKRNVIFDAISYGDEQITKDLISTKGINLNLVDSTGETILHKKEALENEDLCVELIQKGADPTICDKNGKNLLYHTAIKGMDGSRLLDVAVEYGCNINATVRNNNSILMETMGAFYKLSAEELDRRESLLKMAENLVLKGIDVNAINNDGENGLFDAIRNNDYNACAFLLAKDVNPNLQNNIYHTPLLVACMQGIKSLDIILLLLKYEADPTICDKKNRSILEILNMLILHTAKFKNIEDEALLKYIDNHGKYIMVLKEVLQNTQLDLNHLDSQEQPLFFAPILDGYFDLFKLYITNKFDINPKDSSGLNIFYIYVNTVFDQNIYFDTFRSNLLGMINFGVDINTLDSDGKNIFSRIIKKDTDAQLYENLIDVARFKYDSKDKQGRTLAHHAVLNKNLEIIKLIYNKNNDVLNIADSFGILPIVYATLTNCFEIVEQLLSYRTVFIKVNKPVPLVVKKKFINMVNTVDNIKYKTNDKDLLRKLRILVDQIKEDFRI
jgi:ankyrin repeat protein